MFEQVFFLPFANILVAKAAPVGRSVKARQAQEECVKEHPLP